MNDIKPIDCHSHKSAAERMHYTVKLENKSILSFLVPLSYNKNMEMAFFSFEYKEMELMEVKKIGQHSPNKPGGLYATNY